MVIQKNHIQTEEMLLEVWINNQNINQTVLVLIRENGEILVKEKDLIKWNLRKPESQTEIYQNEHYYLLSIIGNFQIDKRLQTIKISIPPQNFLPNMLNVRNQITEIAQTPPLGGFINYDLSVQHSQGNRSAGAQLEFGVFGSWGNATTRVLSTNLSSDPKIVRLDSTLTKDMPEHKISLRLGDSINRSGTWGRSVRFGGIQWGTNFATQPEFISFPLPSLSGQAALPSTAELFINNTKMYQSDILSGPFSLRELPVVTGAGEMRLIVRDMLGREQIITQPYYSAPSILRKGLNDFSYELGFIRKDFGVVSNNYGELVFSGTHRYGFSNFLTGEMRSEIMLNHQNLGFSGALLLPSGMGLVDAAVVVSNNNNGIGTLIGIGFERQTQRLGFGFRSQLTTPEFDQLGFNSRTQTPVEQTTARIGWNSVNFGSIGIGYLRINNRNFPDSEVINASYNRSLAKNWFLSLTTYKNFKNNEEYAVGLVLTHVLGSRTTASLNFNHLNGNESLLASVQQNLPAGTGIGYRIVAGQQNKGYFQGSLNLQNDYGTVTMEAANANGVEAFRTSINGGLAILGNRVFMSRSINDSFAVVRVPGFSNVGVYFENQSVARTDSTGTAFIPRLRPYQKNRISIEQMDLPLDTRIDKLELFAILYLRSGYILEFPVKKSNGASLRVIMEDGQPASSGGNVQIIGQDEIFPVGLNGHVYVTGLKQKNLIRMKLLNKQSCEFEVPFIEMPEPLPHLGTFVCKEMN
ncbi:outer membrane usher protein [Nitrosomonas sp. PY1]|nr:outer membrane usher protein [Nitrosomonas sp. PY1]